jgi:hypothetical protein
MKKIRKILKFGESKLPRYYQNVFSIPPDKTNIKVRFTNVNKNLGN